jgi:hypothetical protein
MFEFLRRMFHDGRFGTLWCSFLHDSPMWPFRDHYECRACGRQHRVPWAEPERTGAPRIRQAPLPSLGSALVPALLLMAVLGRPSLRGQSIASDSSATAAVVLEHFAASLEANSLAPVEQPRCMLCASLQAPAVVLELPSRSQSPTAITRLAA